MGRPPRLLNTHPLLLFSSLLLLSRLTPTLGHQNPSFPGSNDQLQGHHQQAALNQQQQVEAANQQQAAHTPPPPPTPPPAQQFGGDQVKDEGHIKEHLEGKVDQTAQMTPEQLQFHYFNMHDLDRNGKLDGIELIKAITHFHQENPNPQHRGGSLPPPLPTEIELENMIDSILKDDDFNGDGFIDYGEFLKAQKAREEQARLHQQGQTPQP